MDTFQQLNNLIKYHLSLHNLYVEEKLWRIQDSATEGRGLFATCDIQPGEVIFIDHPLLIGPRAGNNFTLHCVICCKLNNLHACTKGCGLPLCSSECEQSLNHFKECELIRKLSKKVFTEISTELFKCLAPLRVFLINENMFKYLTFLTYHASIIHGGEIDAIKEIITFIILDTNTFATVVLKDDKKISVRALYPLATFLNHSCCPNVTHLNNDKGQMILKASVFIPKDSELFITYTSLLWGTSLRRMVQYIGKKFWCKCIRCKDPKEFGSCLSGLKCTVENCKGIIYPLDPLDNLSDWKCEECNGITLNDKVSSINSELGTFLRSIGSKNFEELILLQKNKLKYLVPEKNHVNYEVKVKIIWSLGNKKNYLWGELSMEHLNLKEQLCLDVLELLTQLKLGVCKMRGLILYELYRTRYEINMRCGKDIKSEVCQENLNLLKEAAEILENDVAAPQDIATFIKNKMP